MDMKILLLKSLSSKIPICASRRIYFGKSCFIIKYVVSGKILTIKSIKNTTSKHKTWSQRIKHYQGVYKIYRKKKNHLASSKSKETIQVPLQTKIIQTESGSTKNKETLTPQVSLQTKEVQTKAAIIPPVASKSVATQQEIIPLTTTSQQTIPYARFSVKKGNKSQIPTLKRCSKSCQTILITTACIEIQCKECTQIKATNTEGNTRNSYAQVESDFLVFASTEKYMAEPPMTGCDSGKDVDILIYMLNEIGDIVINQNQLLNNNSEMMRQIMQINLLRKAKSLGSARRSISIQTDQPAKLEQRNIFCQTSPNFTKSRKLLFMNKRSNKHK